MANESLKKLKDTLITTKKYTGLNVNADSLDKLRNSVNQMVDVMNGTRPGGPDSTFGNISGTTCGSFVYGKYARTTVSLGELEEHVSKMPSEACPAVVATTCSCVGRTYLNPCDCQNRITCNCDVRSACDCQTKTKCGCNWDGCCSCDNRGRLGGCRCNSRGCGAQQVTACTCDSRTPCDCQNQIGASCNGRTNQPTCPCNGRCSCNTEKRFT